AGVCVGSGLPDCDDGNPCTDNSCSPGSGCTSLPNAAACDDGDACTTLDSCVAGVCVGGSLLDCSDGDTCTVDFCDSPTGACVNTVQPSLCDVDGDGVPDDQDLCPLVFDPDQADSDADLVGDACDNCPHESAADQADSDGDGRGNVCDLCPDSSDAQDAVLRTVVLKKLLAPAGDQSAPKVMINDLVVDETQWGDGPASKLLLLELVDSDGVLTTLALDPAQASELWRRSPRTGEARSWKFKTRQPELFGGLRTLRFRLRDGGWRFTAKAQDVDLSATSGSFLETRVSLGQGAATTCWSASSSSCRYSPSGDRLRCR
ncbi:MAG: thrombospondin type 3 repeat-containing protein, partial [bacterium]